MLPLIQAHAAFERTYAHTTAALLRDMLSPPAPALRAWVAVADGIIGYATATLDHSTFLGRDFVHLDCLFVSAAHRGCGVGARLLAAARDHAAAIGASELQWQTPAWNADACRFYRRTGATEVPKMRFTLLVGATLVPIVTHDTGGDHGA